MTNARRNFRTAKKHSATELRDFRSFLLMQAFAAREIGQRIHQARKEAGGMTQHDLAEALDVSQRQLQNYEAGETIPWKHFARLEQIFGRPLTWFLHGEGNQETATPPDAEELRQRLDDQQGAIEALTAAVDSLTAAVEETLLPARRVPAPRRRAS